MTVDILGGEAKLGNMTNMKIEWQGLVANVWYDDNDRDNAGWYAEYVDHDGVYSDSVKTWEEEMPTRKTASKRAHAIALRALKKEALARKSPGA